MRLSAKTLEVAYEIHHFILKRKISPTVNEIGKLANLKSRSSVYEHLKRLREADLITWQQGEVGTIQVLKPEFIVAEYQKNVEKKKNDYIYS